MAGSIIPLIVVNISLPLYLAVIAVNIQCHVILFVHAAIHTRRICMGLYLLSFTNTSCVLHAVW